MPLAKRILLDVLIFLMLGFIWGNSMLPRKESGEFSNSVIETAEKVIHPSHELQPPSPPLQNLVRKLAHISEHTVLAVLLFFRYSRKEHAFAYPLALGFAVGALDEFLQLFTDRGSSLVDVMIDFSGVVLGVGFFLLCSLIFKKKTA